MPPEPTTRLFLLRHAHSSWALPGQRDHERGLDSRGDHEARRLAGFIASQDLHFDRIVCSTAKRASATLDIVWGNRPGGDTIESSDDLYALETDAYYEVLAQGGESILMVGHNPMIETFALSLAGSAEELAMAALRAGFPTCGLAILDFDCAAARIGPGSGHLGRLVDPAEL